jgi:CBS domain-containing protein
MDRKPNLVRDIMTREVITLYPEDNLDKVEAGMKRFRFRHLPVVDDGKLVGLVTHRDLLRVAASVLEPGGAQKTKTINDTLFVQDMMQRDVVSAREDMPLLDAGRLMWDQKLGCLPVTKDDGSLVGIVTEADFLKLALELLDRK